MDNTLKNLIDAIHSRFKSTFLFAFFIAWLVINYKFIVVLFSNNTFTTRFEYIDKILLGDSCHHFSYGFLYPFFVACFYTFIWPLIDIVIAAVTMMISHLKDYVMLRLDQKTPVDRTEKEDFFKKYNELVQHYKTRQQVHLSDERALKEDFAQKN